MGGRRSVFNRCVDDSPSGAANASGASHSETVKETDIDDERCNTDMLMASLLTLNTPKLFFRLY